MIQLVLTIFIYKVLEDWGQIHLLFSSRLLFCIHFPDFSSGGGDCGISMKKNRVKHMKHVKRVGSILVFFVVTNSIKRFYSLESQDTLNLPKKHRRSYENSRRCE
jgi:hypothetical protein